MNSPKSKGTLPSELLTYYEAGKEAQRLLGGTGQLEFARTQEIIKRYLPPPPAVVFDVGGGPGIYACWLAREGYEVHLTDVVPLHVEQARQASQDQPNYHIASLKVGDARKIDCADESADAVLLLGPLYHLTERDERIAALREAHRILRAKGFVFAVGISRFASTIDGLLKGFLDDPEFVRIVQTDLAEGQHRNSTNRPGYFTTAYFHHPEELAAEVKEAGFHCGKTIAIEGPGWLLQDLEDRWLNEEQRTHLLMALRWLENEPSVLGVSGHIMVIGQKGKRG